MYFPCLVAHFHGVCAKFAQNIAIDFKFICTICFSKNGIASSPSLFYILKEVNSEKATLVPWWLANAELGRAYIFSGLMLSIDLFWR